MRTRVDIACTKDNILNLQGWAFGRDPETEVQYEVKDEKGHTVPAEIRTARRDSVVEAFFEDYTKQHGEIKRELGYDINIPYEREKTYYLFIRVDGQTRKYRFNHKDIENYNSRYRRRKEKFFALFNPETVSVSLDYFKEHGFKALVKKGIHKIKGIQLEDYDYNEWYLKTCTGHEELAKQRHTKLPLEPKFSIVIPAYKTPERFLVRMLDSIKKQTYGNFEVCVADATCYEGLSWMKDDGREPRVVLEEYHQLDSRFKYKLLNENLGISQNTNEAIRMASEDTDFIVLADHDDEITEDALFELAKAVNENPDIRVMYSDEDKIDFESVVHFEPHFKTDFNPDLLRSVNYICHLFAVKKDHLDRVSEKDSDGQLVYERSEYDGAQDYDLILRCTEKAVLLDHEYMTADKSADKQDGKTEDNSGNKSEDKLGDNHVTEEKHMAEGTYTSHYIHHIRKVLYHWRSHQMSTASAPEAKLYAFTAGEKAVYDHCKRLSLPIREVKKGITYGFYHAIYDNQNPLISVIIPNKDHSGDLDQAIRSMLKGNYQNLEFIVVENNSEKEETFAYYDRIQAELPQVHVVRWEKEFNYSAINNFGVTFAKGEYLLFLNNDIELIEPDSVSEMIGFVQRDDVGVCGARLLYPDGIIQHGGVVVGFGGIAGACFIGIGDDELTYMHRAKCIQDYSAVTAACMLSKKSIFEEVGGFTTDLAVAFNDIDYCMKVRAAGKLVVYNPYAKFYHYESKSRGLEDTPEKVARFNGEIRKFADRWPEILRDGDPYYSPSLTLRKSNFVLRDLSKEQIGEPFPLEV